MGLAPGEGCRRAAVAGAALLLTVLQVKCRDQDFHSGTFGGILNEPMADLVALLGNVLFHFLSLKESAHVFLLDSALSCLVSDQPRIRAEQRETWGFPDGSAGKESACNAGDPGLIPGLGRSPGEGKGYPLQYSDVENSMDCIIHGVAKNRTRLRDFHFALFSNL